MLRPLRFLLYPNLCLNHFIAAVMSRASSVCKSFLEIQTEGTYKVTGIAKCQKLDQFCHQVKKQPLLELL